MHDHVLIFKCLCFPTTNRPKLRIDCSARCIIKYCFHACTVRIRE